MAQSKSFKKTGKPATDDDIWDILGWVDIDTVMAIRQTGANRAELQQAVQMTDSDIEKEDSSYMPVNTHVREVYGILHTAPAAPSHCENPEKFGGRPFLHFLTKVNSLPSSQMSNSRVNTSK